MATAVLLPDYISHSHAMQMLGIGRDTLRKLIKSGELVGVRVPGSRPKVQLASVAELLERSKAAERSAS